MSCLAEGKFHVGSEFRLRMLIQPGIAGQALALMPRARQRAPVPASVAALGPAAWLGDG